MAEIFASPIHYTFPGPSCNYDREKMKAHDSDYLAKVAELARAQSGDDGDELVGEVVRFQIADGHAQYMVWRIAPLQLIHLSLSDAYRIAAAHERGLDLDDIREEVARARAIRAIFAKKASEQAAEPR